MKGEKQGCLLVRGRKVMRKDNKTQRVFEYPYSRNGMREDRSRLERRERISGSFVIPKCTGR